MRSNYEERVAEARKIEGRLSSGRDVFVHTTKFAAVCKVLFDKPAAELAVIGNRDERTAKRWLSGEFEPPNAVVLAVMQEIFKR